MLKLAEGAIKRTKSRAYRSSAVRQTHGLKQAEQWLAEGLHRRDWLAPIWRE